MRSVPTNAARCAILTSLTALAAVLVLSSQAALAATAYSYVGGTYTQDFNSLPFQSGMPIDSSGTATIGSVTYTLPAANTPFDFTNAAIGGGTPISASMNGWWGVGNVADKLGAQDGSLTGGGIIGFGLPTSGDRALGMVGTSGAGVTTFGLHLTNNSGTSYNELSLAFLGEVWRNTSVAKSLNFKYYIDNNGTADLNSASSLGNSDPNLTYAPAVSTSATWPGTNAPATGPVSSTTLSDIINLNTPWASGKDLWLTWQISSSTGSGQGLAIDNLSVTAGSSAASSVTWNTTSGAWDLSSNNWINGDPNLNRYKEHDNVTFGAIAVSSTISVAPSGVSPNSITISNPANTYTFSGGPIGGGGTSGLLMSGGGMAILSSGNTYSGGTQVTGGTLVTGAGDASLGSASGGLLLDNGAMLQTNNVGITSPSRSLTVGTNGATFNSNSFNSSFATPATINGAFIKTGSGDLAFNGGVTLGSAAALTIGASGSLTLGGSGEIQINNNPTINGNLVIAGPLLIDFNGVTTGGTGSILVTNRGELGTAFTLFSNSSGSAGGVVTNKIVLNSGLLAFQKSDVTKAPFAPPTAANGGFLVGFGMNKNAGLGGTTFSGGISGNADVILGTNSNVDGIKTGGGGLRLSATNSYTGATMISGNGPDLSEVPATVILGITNALPVGTDLIFGFPNTSPTRNPTVDLNGFSQTVNSISSTTTDPNSAGKFVITNSGASTSTLTIGGGVTPATPFGGLIRDGVNPIKLVKNGAGSLLLANSNSYSGGTSITNGMLQVSNTVGSATGSGTVSIGSGASLASDPILGGSVGAPGTGLVEIKTNGSLLPGGPGTAGLPLNVLGNLQLDASSSVSFDFAPGDNFKDKVAVVGNLILPAIASQHVTINLNNLGGISGELALFTISSTSSFTNFVPGLSSVGTFTVSGTNNIPAGSHTYDFELDSVVHPGTGSSNQIDLLIGGIPIQAHVTWNASSGTWDTINGNWANGSPAGSLYKDYDDVTFADRPSIGSVVVSTTSTGVIPGAITVNNSATAYKLQGGPIGGFAAINKSGSGTLTLAASNTYGGGTNVTGGTLVVDGGDNRLGNQSGVLTLNGGTVQTVGAPLASTTRSLSIGTNGGTFDSNGLSSSTSGSIVINGTFTKVGSGTLAIGLPTDGTGIVGWTFGTSGVLDVQGGDVVMNGKIALNNFGKMNIHAGSSVIYGTVEIRSNPFMQRNGGVFDGNLIFQKTVRANFDAGDFTGTGEMQFQGQQTWTSPYSGSFTTMTMITDSNGGDTVGGHIFVPIHLNSLVTSSSGFSKCDVTAGTACLPPTDGKSFIATIGGTNPGTTINGSYLQIYGDVYGYSDVIFGGNDLNGSGSGNLILAGSFHYTGTTLMNGNVATTRLGVNNAIPTTSDMVWGTQVNTVAPILDLYGFNQEIASLSYGGIAKSTTAQSNFTIKNNGYSPSTLTISGSTVPYNAFGGAISDGFEPLGLVKSGAGTLILTGSNSYSGGTTVSGGKFLISNSGASATGQGDVTVSGGTFGGIGNVGIVNGSMNLNVASGATLFPGLPASGGTPRTPGTLVVNGNLSLDAGSIVTFSDFSGSGDLIVLNGLFSKLNLPTSGSATINLSNAYGGLDGVHPLFAIPYGSLTNTFSSSQLSIGSAPAGDYSFSLNGGTINLNAAITPVKVWNNPDGGSWATSGNWLGSGTLPPGGGVAVFSGTTSGGTATVSMDGPHSVGALQFGGSGASGNYAITGGPTDLLTLGLAGSLTVAPVLSGTHSISAPIVLAGGLDVLASPNTSLALSGNLSELSPGLPLTLNGGGQLILSGSNNFSGGTTVNLGTLVLTNSFALKDGSSLTVGAGGTLIFDPSYHAGTVSQLTAGSAVAAAAVPEPGTFVLLAVGGLLIAFRASRRRKG